MSIRPDWADDSPEDAATWAEIERRQIARLAAPDRAAPEAVPIEYLPLDDAADWEGLDVPPQRWLWDQFLPVAEASLLTGAGAVGKSLFVHQLCASTAVGRALMGMDVEQAPAIYITCEDSTEELKRRQRAIARTLGATIPRGQFMLKSWKGELDLELFAHDESGRLRPTPRFENLRATALKMGARLIVLDNTAHLFGGDENIKREVAAFANLLNGLAAEIDGVVLLLGHPNKTGLNKSGEGDANQYGGSVAWENQVRSRLLLAAPNKGDHDARVLTNPKANYAPKGGSVAFRWHAGAFVRDEDLPADIRAEIASVAAANAENEAFLACLRARAAQGEGRAVGPSPGPNYAPAQFEGMAQANGYGKPALRQAMDRLFTIGKIESHTYRNTTKARDVTVIREVPDGTPNAFPNASRTLIPNDPEQSARTTPHTLSPLKGGYGQPPEGAPPVMTDADWDRAFEGPPMADHPEWGNA